MEKKFLWNEILEFGSRVKHIFDKDPFILAHLENINLYNIYVRKMKELFPDQKELQELKEINPKQQNVYNDELYVLEGRLYCFLKLFEKD